MERTQERKGLAAVTSKSVMESGRAWSAPGSNQADVARSDVARQMDARQNLDSYVTLSVEENDRCWVPTPKLKARPPQDVVGRQSPRATTAARGWSARTATLVDPRSVPVPTSPTYSYVLEQATLPSTMADPRQRQLAGPRFDGRWLTKAVPVVRRTAVNMRREGLKADNHEVPGSIGQQGKLKIAGKGGMGGSRCGTIPSILTLQLLWLHENRCMMYLRTYRARLEQSRGTVRSVASLAAFESTQSFTTDFTLARVEGEVSATLSQLLIAE